MQKTKKQMAVGLTFALAVAALTGCAGPAKSTTAAPAAAAPAASEATQSKVISGKVLETMNAGGYTYVNLDCDGKSIWAAVPTTDVKAGQELKLYPGMEMRNFQSKALNRTFPSIMFSGGVIADPAAKPAAAAAKPEQAVKQEEPIQSGKVVETINSGNYTYICLEKDGKKGWSAIPATQVKVGDEVEVKEGTPMGSFTSKSLNRTFDNIVFASGIVKK